MKTFINKHTRLTTGFAIQLAGFILLLLSVENGYGQSGSNTSLYLSKQTNQYSSFTGSDSKTTDKHENGSVIVSTSGPIKYSVTPADFSIGPNQTKTWTGIISPDMSAAPAAGSSASGSITGHFQVHYKVGGVFDPSTGKWVVDGVDKDTSGDVTENFTVYSIKASLPDTICIGSSMQGSATVVTFPANGEGATYNWEIIGTSIAISLTNTNSQTVSISMADSSIMVPIKVTYTIQGVEYSTTSIVKHCTCQCGNITGGMTFGPISATFNAPPASSSPDGQGFCSYSVNNASFNISLNGIISKQASITGANVSFKKNCQTGAWKDVSITWNGDLDIGDLSFINGKLKSLNLSVSTAGNLSGSATINVSMAQDKALMNGLVILKQGVNGDVTFTFNNTNGWDGSFDFSGVHNINLDIVKGATIIANVQNGNLNASGTFTGTFNAVSNATYTTDAFRITMNSLSLGVEMSMANGVNFTNGNGSVTVDQIAHSNGALTLALEFGNGNCNASVTSAGFSALSMTLTNLNLQADFNSNFDLTQFRGALDAKHDLFDLAVHITEFEIKDGSLTKFNGSAKVGYRGFSFDLLSATYTPGTLTITAKVEINVTLSAMLEVTNMTINDAGNITVGGISGDLNRAPVTLKFSATMDADRFKGTFSGTFTTISVGGMVDIGAVASPAYNFAYLSLTAGTNIPLGQSGLKISQLGGQFGMNYQLTNPTQPGGNPSQGNYVVGLSLGIADVANMCELQGQTVAQFGNGNLLLTLSGTLNVLKNNPYFSGNMTINYQLPAQQISGSVSSVVKFPGNGWILQTNNASVNFSVGGGQWTASGNNMSGTLLSHINLSNGSINFSGSTSSPLNMSGSIGGTASAGFNYGVNFSGLGCSLSGNMQMNMNSNINASINQNGLNGCFGVHVDGSGTLAMSNWFFGGNVNVSGTCDGNICANNGGANVSGTMLLNLPFGLQPGINFNIGI
jgi:hypothetical protein